MYRACRVLVFSSHIRLTCKCVYQRNLITESIEIRFDMQNNFFVALFTAFMQYNLWVGKSPHRESPSFQPEITSRIREKLTRSSISIIMTRTCNRPQKLKPFRNCVSMSSSSVFLDSPHPFPPFSVAFSLHLLPMSAISQNVSIYRRASLEN